MLFASGRTREARGSCWSGTVAVEGLHMAAQKKFSEFCGNLRTPPASRGSLAAPVICTVFVAADLGRVRFAPKASQLLRGSEMTRCARTGCEQSQQNNPYSITSSAMASSPGGKLRPKALAVLRLITNSNLVDCMTGRSPGFSPLRIRPVYTPAWRYASLRLVP